MLGYQFAHKAIVNNIYNFCKIIKDALLSHYIILLIYNVTLAVLSVSTNKAQQSTYFQDIHDNINM